MFEVGFTEIIVIVGLALLVLGPEKLPGLVSTVGRWMGRARVMARQLQMQLEQEAAVEELRKSAEEIRKSAQIDTRLEAPSPSTEPAPTTTGGPREKAANE